MISLGWTLLKAQGWTRSMLIAGCSAAVSVLILLVIALLRLRGLPSEFLIGVLMDAGTRGGAILAVALLTLPALVLLYQVVKLGSATREVRLAGLRVAGATAGEIRRLAAFEVGLPAGIGAVVGVVAYAALRLLVGGEVVSDGVGFVGGVRAGLVPTTVAATWWQVLLVVVALALAGAAIGSRVSSSVMTTPLGVLRRTAETPPRPWGLVLTGVALAGAGLLLLRVPSSDVSALVLVGVAAIGLMLAAPWVGYRTACLVEVRCHSASALLAARRVQSRPRAIGRAAAAVGAVCLAGGGASVILGFLAGYQMFETFYVVALILLAVLMLLALLLVTFSMAASSVDALLSEKRSTAALHAVGMPVNDFDHALELELALVAIPMAMIGFFVGAGGLLIPAAVGGPVGPALVAAVIGLVVVLALVLGAVRLSSRIVRPWSHRSFAVGHLRTE